MQFRFPTPSGGAVPHPPSGRGAPASRAARPRPSGITGLPSSRTCFRTSRWDRPIPSTFYQHFRDDIALMQEIGHNSFRTSISWARLLPQGGANPREAVRFYHAMLDELLARGITLHQPVPTSTCPMSCRTGLESRKGGRRLSPSLPPPASGCSRQGQTLVHLQRARSCRSRGLSL